MGRASITLICCLLAVGCARGGWSIDVSEQARSLYAAAERFRIRDDIPGVSPSVVGPERLAALMRYLDAQGALLADELVLFREARECETKECKQDVDGAITRAMRFRSASTALRTTLARESPCKSCPQVFAAYIDAFVGFRGSCTRIIIQYTFAHESGLFAWFISSNWLPVAVMLLFFLLSLDEVRKGLGGLVLVGVIAGGIYFCFQLLVHIVTAVHLGVWIALGSSAVLLLGGFALSRVSPRPAHLFKIVSAVVSASAALLAAVYAENKIVVIIAAVVGLSAAATAVAEGVRDRAALERSRE